MSTNGCIVYLSAADCQHTSQHSSLILFQHSTVYLGSNQVSIKLVLCFNQQLIVNKHPSAVLFFLSTKYRLYGQSSLNNAFVVFYQQLIANKFHSTVLHHIVNKAPSIIRASKHQHCLYNVIISSWLSTNFTTLLFITLSTKLGLTDIRASKQLVKRKRYRWASSTLASVCNSISNFSCFPL